MIEFEKNILANGLPVIIHEDHTLPMVVVNVLYDVGSRDENPEQTGLAHLFEHLMFGGSVNIPSYDEPLQRVGGENNAFTSNDLTNYYIQVPSVNVETAFWLESDRMLGLAFSEKSLDVQRSVVIEEFKQRYLNQPYGDAWLHLRPLVYQKHPYQWATIGKNIAHIEQVQIEEVKAFFAKHYSPSNAILVIAGDISVPHALELSSKWFGSIARGEKYVRHLPTEPRQIQPRFKEIKAKVPADALYMAFPMPGKTDPGFHATELLSDILSKGTSSRLYQSVVKNQVKFSEIHSYLSGDLDPGMFVIEGKLNQGVSRKEAIQAVWDELDKLSLADPEEKELTKVKNKLESTMVFSEMNLLDKAINLAYFELEGDAGKINEERSKFLQVIGNEIRAVASKLFLPELTNELYYIAH